MDFDVLVQSFGKTPEPWVEGRTIPWDDPEFSRRMLREHLSQAHDAASRTFAKIDRHVDFIEDVALKKTPSRILDLGCGPGLYSLRLAERGHECHGIDFSPASIEYAQAEVRSRGANCSFELGDIQVAEFGTGFDLVMLLFGELNLFPRDDAVALLARCRAAMAPEGVLLLEPHSYEGVKQRGTAAATWSAREASVFSDHSHLRLEEAFWHEEGDLAVGRYWVVYPGETEVELYGWTMQAYDPTGYERLLAEAGFRLVATHSSLTGQPDNGDLPVLVAQPSA